jgi:xanthine/CO dehydrogenase XdhC/CoxF family maturation factor
MNVGVLDGRPDRRRGITTVRSHDAAARIIGAATTTLRQLVRPAGRDELGAGAPKKAAVGVAAEVQRVRGPRTRCRDNWAYRGIAVCRLFRI